MWWDGTNYWYRNVPYRCKKCCHIWIVTDCKIIIFTRLTPCLFAIGATPKETQLNCHRGAVKELFLRYQNTIQFLHMLRLLSFTFQKKVKYHGCCTSIFCCWTSLKFFGLHCQKLYKKQNSLLLRAAVQKWIYFTLCFIQSQCHHPSPLFHDKWHEKGLKKNCSAFIGTLHWAFASPNVTFGSLNHNVTIFTGTTVNWDELICFALCFIQSQSTMSPVFCIETI